MKLSRGGRGAGGGGGGDGKGKIYNGTGNTRSGSSWVFWEMVKRGRNVKFCHTRTRKQCIIRLWEWDLINKAMKIRAWAEQQTYFGRLITAQLNGCIPAANTNFNKTEKAWVRNRNFYLSWYFIFIFQWKVVLCMVFLAYTEGLVETNTNKKHFW